MKKMLLNKLGILGIYVASAIIIEVYFFIFFFHRIFASYFFYDFCVILILGCLSYICGKYKPQIIVSTVLLTIQIALATINFALNNANGDIFSWDMISLFIDAAKAATGAGGANFVKYVHLLFFIPWVGFTLFSMILFKKKFIDKRNKDEVIFNYKAHLKTVTWAGVTALVCISCNVTTSALIHSQNKAYKVSSDAYLYDSQFIKQEALKKFGSFGYYYISGKNNLTRTFSKKKKVTTVRSYLDTGAKEDTSNAYTGVSKGNNLIYILFETGEWFGLNKEITPNLYSLMNSDGVTDKNGKVLDGGITLTSYYSKSQTNISEAQSLFGSYPTSGILNYNYSDNKFSYTLPSVFKQNYPEAQVNSYHSNNGDYYNRNEAHVRYGFDEHIDAVDMGLEAVNNETWIRLDSEMFSKCLSSSTNYDTNIPSIVPDDKSNPFFSYIISFSTHGPYVGRDYLNENREYVLNNITNPFKTLRGDTIDLNNDLYGDEILTYLAAAYDFDLGIGQLIDDLRQKDELENTTIMIFADHYAYYSKLSAVTKGFDSQAVTYPEIYNVPAIIFDTKLKKKMKENITSDNNIKYKDYNGDKIFTYDKFCGNIDFANSLMNIFDFDYNPHCYTGRDIFGEESSFVLSRYGGLFNKEFYTSDGTIIDNIPEQFYYYEEEESAGVPLSDIEEAEGLSKDEYSVMKIEIDNFLREASEFLTRQEYMDKIYQTNYFGLENN